MGKKWGALWRATVGCGPRVASCELFGSLPPFGKRVRVFRRAFRCFRLGSVIPPVLSLLFSPSCTDCSLSPTSPPFSLSRWLDAGCCEDDACWLADCGY